MNRKEMQGLMALLAVIVLGLGAQSYQSHRRGAGVWIEQAAPNALAPVGLTAPKGQAKATPRALRDDGRLDLNAAEAIDLEALGQIGKVRAQAIVAYRESHGPFAALEDLERVPGIAQKTVEAVRASLWVAPAPAQAAAPEAPAANAAEQFVDINTASARELEEGLWNIGEKKATAIVAWRERHGRFASAHDLQKVPGIGAKTIERNRARIRASRGP